MALPIIAIFLFALPAPRTSAAPTSQCFTTLPLPTNGELFIVNLVDFDVARKAKVLTKANEFDLISKAEPTTAQSESLVKFVEAIPFVPFTIQNIVLTLQGPTSYATKDASCVASNMLFDKTEIVRLKNKAKAQPFKSFDVVTSKDVAVIRPIGEVKPSIVQEAKDRESFLREQISAFQSHGAMNGLMAKGANSDFRASGVFIVPEKGKYKYVVVWSADDLEPAALKAKAEKLLPKTELVTQFGKPTISIVDKRVELVFPLNPADRRMVDYLGSRGASEFRP